MAKAGAAPRRAAIGVYRRVRSRSKILAPRGVVRVANVLFVRESIPRAMFFGDAFHALEAFSAR